MKTEKLKDGVVVGERELWILRQQSAALQAIMRQEAIARATASENAAKLRKLNLFLQVLLVKQADSSQMELFSTEEVLTDEVKALLAGS